MSEHDPFSHTPAPAPEALNVDLTQFDDDFEKAEAAQGDDVPDGKYQVRIQAVCLNKSQAGNPMLQYDLLVLFGPHAQRHIFKNSVITQNSMPFFKADLKVMGIQIPKLSDLPNHLDGMLDLALEVTKKTKGDYSNVYFNKRLLTAPSDVPAAGPIPF